MKVIRSKEFTANRAWGAEDIADMDGTTVRLHWTDQPYQWHINDGQEVFAVLDGTVDMHYRASGVEQVVTLEAGDVFMPKKDASMSLILVVQHGFWLLNVRAVSDLFASHHAGRMPCVLLPLSPLLLFEYPVWCGFRHAAYTSKMGKTKTVRVLEPIAQGPIQANVRTPDDSSGEQQRSRHHISTNKTRHRADIGVRQIVTGSAKPRAGKIAKK